MAWKRFYCLDCEWTLHEQEEGGDQGTGELSRRAIDHTVSTDHDIDSEWHPSDRA